MEFLLVKILLHLFAVKPTSSILTSRETIDKKGKNTKISVKGRHDPCVGIRAVPIGEAMISCVILDHLTNASSTVWLIRYLTFIFS